VLNRVQHDVLGQS